MVAAGPVQTSASSSTLEQRSAEHIVKRTGFTPEYINSLNKEGLEALHEHAKTTLQEAEEALAKHNGLYGNANPGKFQTLTTEKQVADELMANVQAALAALNQAALKAQLKDWGEYLHLAPPSA
ncbi:unnamed protein product [Tilletia controversa]|nr:unnamed protein product [Tilletia controversa]CAD6964100.1 unnamed protein product [Tilletia laevis]